MEVDNINPKHTLDQKEGLSLVFSFCDKTLMKDSLGRKGFISAYRLRLSCRKAGQELKTGIWKLGINQRLQKEMDYWLVFLYKQGPLSQRLHHP